MTPAPRTLRELLADSADAGAVGDIVVRGLKLDSRDVVDGDLFVALRGTRQHGIAFADRAERNGAVAVLAETPVAGNPGGLPLVAIDGLGEKLGGIAARWHGDPSRQLAVVGVTGTNGKTSTVQLLAQALALNGRRAATIGTLGAGFVGELQAGERTTPDAIALQGLFAGFRDGGASDVAIEVSSHALEQGRVNAVAFDIAVFTNLSRDHLDYHGDMASYGAAKARLFGWPGLDAAVINVDDPFGATLVDRLGAGVRRLRCGIDRDDVEVAANDIRSDAAGLHFALRTPWGSAEVLSRLLGRFNVANLLAVIACLGQSGIAFDAIVRTLPLLAPVPGRMNRIDGDDIVVVVDYAHTPDALEQALANLRAHCHGKLLCVFGCGGDRDAGKRPQMAAIAERLADAIIVTDDNPRSEDGDAIVAQIVAGLRDPGRAMVERDRGRAIRLATLAALPGDVVLVAGKGHEDYQEIGDRRLPFDDRLVAREALEARR